MFNFLLCIGITLSGYSAFYFLVSFLQEIAEEKEVDLGYVLNILFNIFNVYCMFRLLLM